MSKISNQGQLIPSISKIMKFCLLGAWRDDKGFEIYKVSLEFESGRAPLIRVSDSWDFTCSPGPIKCFLRDGVSSNPKKKQRNSWVLI